MDIGIILVYLGGLLALGLYQTLSVKGMHQYALSGRRYGSFVVFASLSASFIGGGFSSGNAAQVCENGMGSAVSLWGFSFGQVLLGVLLLRKTPEVPKASSPGELLLPSCGTFGRTASGICSALLCAGLLGVQFSAMGGVFAQLLNIPYAAGVIIGAVVVLIYATAGGMAALVKAELIQFLLLAAGMPLLLVFSLHYSGGRETVLAALPKGFAALGHGFSPALFFTSLFGELLTPAYLQRTLIGKSTVSTARATVWSGLFSAPFFLITGMIGLCALTVLPGNDFSVAMPYMIIHALPAGIKGFITVSLLAIVMSSADGLLGSLSLAVVSDIVTPFSKKKPDEASQLRLARLVSLAGGLAGLAAALLSRNLIGLLTLSYSAWAPVMLVPMSAALLNIKTDRKTLLASSAFGGSVCIIILGLSIGKNAALSGEWMASGAAAAGAAASVVIFTVLRLLRNVKMSYKSIDKRIYRW